jgi:hypothetical protein
MFFFVVRVEFSFETTVRRTGSWCEMAVSLAVRQLEASSALELQ